MKHLYLGLSFTFFSVRLIVASEHRLLLAKCGVKQKPEIPRVFAPQTFSRESLRYHTLLLCDWSVQQSANKPQTQKEKNVVRM